MCNRQPTARGIKGEKEHPSDEAGVFQAGGRGFEPRHTDPESAVLPLDEPPTERKVLYHRLIPESNDFSWHLL